MGRHITYTEMFVVRVKPEVGAYLDKLKDAGGYTSRAHVIRSIIDDIKRDDEMAHGEAST